MFDEAFSLQDSALALLSEWQLLADTYERHAADLLRSCLATGDHAPGALARDLSDVIRHTDYAAQLRACSDSLGELLEESEEVRIRFGSAQPPRVIHSPPLEGVGGPEPF